MSTLIRVYPQSRVTGSPGISLTRVWGLGLDKMSESSPKADQWRNLGTVLVVALYHAWQVDSTIPDTDTLAP